MQHLEERDALSEALRIMRVFHDLNQSEAAEQLSISAPYLSQLESGKKAASLDVIQKYAATFEVSASSIFLLSERLQVGRYTYDQATSLAAPKILRILDWLHEKNKAVPKKAAARVETTPSRQRKQA